MKKVLWISRHEMTNEQKQDLIRILEDEIELVVLNKTLNSVKEITPYLEQISCACVVLPTILLSELTKIAKDIPIYQSVSKRLEVIDEVTNTKKFNFVHDYWQHIIKLDFEYKNL